MKKALLIAEKPSEMRAIKEVYDKHINELSYSIDFVHQRGHLVELLKPSEIDPAIGRLNWDTLPYYPSAWKYRVKQETKKANFKTTQELYSIIKNRINSGEYDFVINAGDPDQEGELLVNLVLDQIGNTLPVARFWTNDMTEQAILLNLQNLRNDKTDPMLLNMLAAGKIRQHCDYLFGMNLSSAVRAKMKDKHTSVGRVMTFMQAVVVQREKEIANFKPTTVYGVKAIYDDDTVGTLFSDAEAKADDKDEDAKNGTIYFDAKSDAEEMIYKLNDTGKVIKYETKHTKTLPPKLFKLSSAQQVAGKSNINPKQTLEAIQSLYDKQYMSYPRTSCEYLASGEDLEGILHKLFVIDELKPFISKITKEDIARVRGSKKWINDAELEKSGHSALRPTTVVPDLSKLTPQEKFIYLMVTKRFVAIFLQPWEQDQTEMIVDVDGNTFRTRGKVTTSRGYLDIFNQQTKDDIICKKNVGDDIHVKEFEPTEKTSKCPSHLTQTDLVTICENPKKYLNDKSLTKTDNPLRIGTPATRVPTIDKLINKVNYLETFTESKKEYIRPTELGKTMIDNMEGMKILKADMTGTWEIMLEKVRRGELDSMTVETQIWNDMLAMLREVKDRDMTEMNGNSFTDTGYICPVCKKGNVVSNTKYFKCSENKKGDDTSCWFFGSYAIKTLKCKLKETDLQKLCEVGVTNEITMTSPKTGNKFKAMLKINEEKKSLGLVFPDNKTDLKCPICSGNVIKFSKGYKCANKDCNFIVWDTQYFKKIPDEQLQKVIRTGKSDEMWFKTKNDKKFKSYLLMTNEGKVIVHNKYETKK